MDADERNALIQDAKEVSLIRLRRRRPTHSEVVVEARTNLERYLPDFTEDDLALVVAEIEYNTLITAPDPDVLVNKMAQTDWFNEADSNVKKSRFERYMRYLRSEGFPENVLTTMTNSTRRILSLAADPKSVEDFKRGLVVGEVQSGKTANYLSLINLACDFGYKIVVLLAGMTDSLREQTQERIDLGFIGAVSDSIGGQIKYIGVGEVKEEHYAVPLTNTKQDFVKWLRKNINSTPSEYLKPLVLVVKKNKGVLEQVTEWLRTRDIDNLNLLLIDDEADNASVNVNRKDYDPTQINRKIRELLSSFKVASYIGFTATPFANIFINPKDDKDLKSLFPADFIVQLTAPDNYCGAHWFFDERKKKSRLRILDEKEPYFLPAIHKKDASFSTLPDSMKEAILVFLLGCAIRTKRGQRNKHRTMLVNISRFNDLQFEIRYVIKEFVSNLAATIEQESYKTLEGYLKNPLLMQLYKLYMEKELFKQARLVFDFDSLRQELKDEIDLFEVAVINNTVKQEERFSYKERKCGARVIAVGGFLLSRGLTLEGLMVSYYSRNTAAYDSLLQMGRWFGYRFGYDDLCVLYISAINVANFNAVISAVDDLRNQFKIMCEDEKKKPKDFGLMVKCSPDTLETDLLVTSRNKMRRSKRVEFWISYGGTVADTSKIYKDELKNKLNREQTVRFVSNLLDDGHEFNLIGSRRVIKNVSQIRVANFVNSLNIHFENRKFDVNTLSQYILESEVFPQWDIVVATGEDATMQWEIGGFCFDSAIRKSEIREEEDFIRVGLQNNRLIDPGIFAAGLTEAEVAEVKYHAGKKPTYMDYLSVKDRNPLLVFYPVSIVKDYERVNNEPYIGYAVGFPTRGRAEKVAYQANEKKREELLRSMDSLDPAELIGGVV